MAHSIANVGRVFAGVVVLFIAWLVGVYIGGSLFFYSELINKMETLPTKIGGSLGVMVASLFLVRFLLRSFRLALTCLGVTEGLVFLIIIHFTGLLPFTLYHLRFNASWLYALTWNVIIAFLFGAVIGHLWSRRAANKKRNVANLE